MLALINGVIRDVRLIERGSSGSPGCLRNELPLLVEYDGRRLWVFDDEGDGRKIPGDRGPVKCLSPRDGMRWS